MPEVVVRKPIHAGTYVLDNTINLHGSRTVLFPHNEQLMGYANSSMEKTFKYAGKGIYYREYQRGTLSKLLNIATFFDLSNLISYEWCTPGDTRIWFEYFAPPKLAVVGKKNGDMITSVEVEGYKIGAASGDDISLSDIIKANFSWIPSIFKWIIRVALFFLVFTGYESMEYTFVALGLVVVVDAVAHSVAVSMFISRWFKNLFASSLAGLALYLLHSLIIPYSQMR